MCLQVPLSSSGSLVYKLDPLAPASQVLRENDVVVEIDGTQIADGALPVGIWTLEFLQCRMLLLLVGVLDDQIKVWLTVL